MKHSSNHQPIAATCTFALRLSDGRFVSDPRGEASYSLEAAHLWLWPLDGDPDTRAGRITEVVKRHPWIGHATAVRSRS